MFSEIRISCSLIIFAEKERTNEGGPKASKAIKSSKPKRSAKTPEPKRSAKSSKASKSERTSKPERASKTSVPKTPVSKAAVPETSVKTHMCCLPV